MKLSCLILTKNNGKTLEYALRSICSYVDEIVLLDSGSDDNTLEIGQKYTKKIFYREFSGSYSKQRNYGIKQCNGDWIFLLDSDELVGENFHRCLKYLKKPYKSIAIPRCHIIDIKNEKQLITPTHYYDWQTRFIYNDGATQYYEGKPVHETLINNKPRLHCCEANIFHLDFLINDYEKRKNKSDYYAKIGNGGFPQMYLPEDFHYYTMSLMELPEENILHDLKEDTSLSSIKYELNNSNWISFRELLKWDLRQSITRLRGTFSV